MAFCAGASFDELLAVNTPEEGKVFFMGFANVINAMRRCPQPIIARVHGKAVGGGVGLISACDYALALPTAEVKLSEIAIGIGPACHRTSSAAQNWHCRTQRTITLIPQLEIGRLGNTERLIC